MIDRSGYFLIVLMMLQAGCAGFFVYDVTKDLIEGHGAAGPIYLATESIATLSLLIAIGLEWRRVAQIREDHQSARRVKQVATGQVSQLMKDYFGQWALTASEADVAELTIKGCGISEIAILRECRIGTVKAHLNAIYRKSGTSGRHELISLIIEDLMETPLTERKRAMAG